tara:strand:- start:7734 stop:8333 length:600 start_codon:yes stop_codon:yes gene_type:complete
MVIFLRFGLRFSFHYNDFVRFRHFLRINSIYSLYLIAQDVFKMFVFRKHLIKRGTYKRVKDLYNSKIEEGNLPTKNSIDELLHEKELEGPLEANFSLEVPIEVAEATVREESMESFYDDMKAGAPVQCIGIRTRKKHRCAICMRRKKTKIRIRCGHIFHRKCIDTWARWNPVCPTCKDALDLKPPAPLALPTEPPGTDS